ncbi:hypothetical protein AAY473_002357 [Plecturocebus cupreus]
MGKGEAEYVIVMLPPLHINPEEQGEEKGPTLEVQNPQNIIPISQIRKLKPIWNWLFLPNHHWFVLDSESGLQVSQVNVTEQALHTRCSTSVIPSDHYQRRRQSHPVLPKLVLNSWTK